MSRLRFFGREVRGAKGGTQVVILPSCGVFDNLAYQIPAVAYPPPLGRVTQGRGAIGWAERPSAIRTELVPAITRGRVESHGREIEATTSKLEWCIGANCKRSSPECALLCGQVPITPLSFPGDSTPSSSNASGVGMR